MTHGPDATLVALAGALSEGQAHNAATSPAASLAETFVDVYDEAAPEPLVKGNDPLVEVAVEPPDPQITPELATENLATESDARARESVPVRRAPSDVSLDEPAQSDSPPQLLVNSPLAPISHDSPTPRKQRDMGHEALPTPIEHHRGSMLTQRKTAAIVGTDAPEMPRSQVPSQQEGNVDALAKRPLEVAATTPPVTSARLPESLVPGPPNELTSGTAAGSPAPPSTVLADPINIEASPHEQRGNLAAPPTSHQTRDPRPVGTPRAEISGEPAPVHVGNASAPDLRVLAITPPNHVGDMPISVPLNVDPKLVFDEPANEQSAGHFSAPVPMPAGNGTPGEANVIAPQKRASPVRLDGGASPSFVLENVTSSDVHLDPQTEQPIGAAQPTDKPAPGPANALASMPNPVRTIPYANWSSQLMAALPTPGDGTVEITLAPEELGRVRMMVTQNEVGVSIQFMIERPDTLELMRRHMGSLALDLGQMGFSDMEFAFSSDTDTTPDDDHVQTTPDNDGGGERAIDRAPSEMRQPITNDSLDLRL